MRDGSTKAVRDIVKGDQVATRADGVASYATIQCLIKFEIPSKRKRLCRFENGLLVTPGHPILHQGEWAFPRDVQAVERLECDAVYNLIVDRHHVVFVNDVPLILPGHGFEEGILKHEYLGTTRVIEDLKQVRGWSEGAITLRCDLSPNIRKYQH